MDGPKFKLSVQGGGTTQDLHFTPSRLVSVSGWKEIRPTKASSHHPHNLQQTCDDA